MPDPGPLIGTSPHQRAGPLDRARTRSPGHALHSPGGAPRDQEDSTTTSERRSTDPHHLPLDSANTGNEQQPSLKANPEDAMRLIAQMSPTQHAQMKEQM